MEKKNFGESPFVKFIFNYRSFVLTLFAIITFCLGHYAFKIRLTASFLKMIPTYNEYIHNYIKYQDDLKGFGNVVKICVETKKGNIFNKKFLHVLREVTNEVFYFPGVDRAALKSLWTPQARWTELTPEGFEGGPIIPDDYRGSKKDIDRIRINVMRSGEIGAIVANNFKSAIVFVPLLEKNPQTGKSIDYKVFADKLTYLKKKFESKNIKIHIIGFAMLMGDLINGAKKVATFFGISFILLLLILYYNCRCWKGTLARALSSGVAIIWLLGLLKIFHLDLNPYSLLVPFLMFALGVSHGIQIFNAMVLEMVKGRNKLEASKQAFITLYIPGLGALFTDCIGFATLFVIKIGVIQDIAIGASIGVAVIAFTDLMLLPILLSYTGVSKKTIELFKERVENEEHTIWKMLVKITKPKIATMVIIGAAILLGISFYLRADLKIGDIDPGAPELRPDSVYNQDVTYINKHYGTSNDIFVVILKTPPSGNSKYNTVVAVDQLKWELLKLKGVQSVNSYVKYIKLLNSAFSEGNLKWRIIPRSQIALDNLVLKVPTDITNPDGTISPIMVYLKDHKADTLQRVVDTVKKFAKENNCKHFQFLLAAGNAGIEAATNIEVKKAHLLMTIFVYSVVFLVCLLIFRSFFGAICVLVPLFITSILCEAIMAKMGIGIKVATLSVIAVGVGVGVDYGIYIFNKFRYYLEKNCNISEAYYKTLNTTGRAVTFTGITLSIGVVTWAFSPIKFQADMGVLLTFMFLWNMVGAIVLLPALARYLVYPKYKKQKPEKETH